MADASWPRRADVAWTGMQQTGTPAVAFEHVSKRFGDAVAVDDANLDIDEGAFVTIIGSSGCGKTTLFNELTGSNGTWATGPASPWRRSRRPGARTAT